MKNKVLFYLIYLSPLFCMALGMIAFTIAGFMVNTILGTVLIGISFVVLAIMLVPLKMKVGDK